MADTYTPPVAVAENAQRALDVRATKPPSQQGMTPIGLARANQLAKREAVSLTTIRRMVAYFDRHEVDKQGSTWDEQGKGWQAWMGWGGDEGRMWANRILQESTKMETKSMDNFNSRQRMIAASLMEVAHEEGKFDWSVGANGAHYVPASENPFLPQNIRCEECIFFANGNECAIVGGEIEANAVCKFWTIPEQEIIQVLPVSDVTNTTDQTSGDTPIFMGASAMEAMGLIDDMKSVMTMDEARTIVQEYAQLHPDKASIVYESIEQDLMSGKVTKEELLGQSSKVSLSTAERDALPDEDFAIPSSRNFPINSPTAISDAVSGWGRYRGDVSFETFKQNLIKIAIRKGQAYVDALPQAWQDEMQKHIVMTAKRYLALLDS